MKGVSFALVKGFCGEGCGAELASFLPPFSFLTAYLSSLFQRQVEASAGQVLAALAPETWELPCRLKQAARLGLGPRAQDVPPCPLPYSLSFPPSSTSLRLLGPLLSQRKDLLGIEMGWQRTLGPNRWLGN